jgi:predicted nucleic acid-binding protein
LIVPDTSILVKWFVGDEPLVDEARRIRRSLIDGDSVALAPVHLPIELAAALVRCARRGRLSVADVPRAMESIRRFEFETVDLVGGSISAAAISTAVGIHPADALFIVAALGRSATLVTADLALLDAARAVGCSALSLADVGASGADV